MTRTTPTTYTDLDPAPFLRDKVVELADHQAIAQRLHYQLSRAGGFAGGRILNPAGETQSSTYNRADDGASEYDLANWQTCFRFQRRATDAKLRLIVFGQNIDVRLTVRRWNGSSWGSFATQPVASCGGTSEWAEATMSITEGATHEGASTANPLAVFLFDLEWKATAALPATNPGKLWYWAVHEDILTASQIPTS